MPRCLPPLVCLLTAFAESADAAPKSFPVLGSQSTVDWLNAYAAASGLKPLRADDTPTLRVWIEDVMTGQSSGYVVTSQTTLICRTSYVINGSTSISIRPATCRSKRTLAQDAHILDLLPDLAHFNKSDLNCGVMDGIQVSVEGVAAGRQFALAAGNPSFCTDPGSVLVTKTLNLLPKK
jgi:hypothetical protein